MPDKHPDTARWGGPGASHEDATKPQPPKPPRSGRGKDEPTNTVFSHQGKHWEFPPAGGSAGHPAYAKFGQGQDADGIVRQIGIAPRCYQDPHPPIYGGFAGSMRTVDFWAREGGKPIVLSGDMDFCDALWARYTKVANESDSWLVFRPLIVVAKSPRASGSW